MFFHPLELFLPYLIRQKWLLIFLAIDVAMKEVNEMKIKMKEKGQGNKLGIIKNFKPIPERINKKISVKSQETAFPSSTTYIQSEAYKAHRAEIELKRSKAFAEVYRHHLRGR